MPYVWVDPEKFLEYNGVTIYHVYRNDNFNDVRAYLYTVDVSENHIIDIRDLPEYDNRLAHDEVLRRAIDNKSAMLQEALSDLENNDLPPH